MCRSICAGPLQITHRSLRPLVTIPALEEHLEPRTGYSLDLALPSSRAAVEVDGPSHFLLPDGRGVRKPNGPTLLKRRLLTAAGWRVISVPFYEWDGFATAKERQTYLQGAVAPLLGL